MSINSIIIYAVFNMIKYILHRAIRNTNISFEDKSGFTYVTALDKDEVKHVI